MHNFYSDTQTKPTRAMLATVMDAEVGDEQRFEDPTTIRLEQRVADLLGKEAAVFLPSGSMCNEISIKVHTSPSDEVICDRSSHIIGFESGGPAMLSGVMIYALEGDRGRFSAEQVRQAIRPAVRYMPRSRLVSIEQTANLAGGSIWPVDLIDEVAAVAHQAGLATHMDGARLLNAVVATAYLGGTVRSRYGQCVDRSDQGPRSCGRGRADGQPGLHRPGLALEAAMGRSHAPVGHPGRHGSVRPRSSRGPVGRGPRPGGSDRGGSGRHVAGRGGSPRRDQHCGVPRSPRRVRAVPAFSSWPRRPVSPCPDWTGGPAASSPTSMSTTTTWMSCWKCWPPSSIESPSKKLLVAGSMVLIGRLG